MMCLFDRGLTPHLGESFYKAFVNLNMNGTSIFNSMPLVLFSFMYQTNIPMIYSELQVKTPKTMWSVMFYGTAGASVAYILAGVFGYVTFAANPEVDNLMS